MNFVKSRYLENLKIEEYRNIVVWVISCFLGLVAAFSFAISAWARYGLDTDLQSWAFSSIVGFVIASSPLWLINSKNYSSRFAVWHLAIICAIIIIVMAFAFLPIPAILGKIIIFGALFATFWQIFKVGQSLKNILSIKTLSVVALGLLLGLVIIYGYALSQISAKGLFSLKNGLGSAFGIDQVNSFLVWCLAVLLLYFGLLRVKYNTQIINQIFLGIAACLLAYFVASIFVFIPDAYFMYDSIYGKEQAAVGVRHLDSAFHRAIINAIATVGYPSTGQDGYVFTYYHFISHTFIAGLANLTGLQTSDMVQVFRALVIPVWFLSVAFYSVFSLLKIDSKNHQVRPSVISILLFCVLFGVLLYQWQYSLVSTPNTIATILVLATAPVIFSFLFPSKNIDNISIINAAIILFIAGAIISFSKVSSGYIIFALSGWALLVRFWVSKITIIFGVLSLSVLASSLLLFTSSSSGESTFMWAGIDPIMKHLPYALIIIFFLATPKFIDAMSIKYPSWKYRAIIAGWVGLAILPIAILRISTSDQLYFELPILQISWVLFAVILVNYWLEFAQKITLSAFKNISKIKITKTHPINLLVAILVACLISLIITLPNSHGFKIVANPFESAVRTSSLVVAQISSNASINDMPKPNLQETAQEIKERKDAARILVAKTLRETKTLMPRDIVNSVKTHPLSILISALDEENNRLNNELNKEISLGIFLPKDLASWSDNLFVSSSEAVIAMQIFSFSNMPLLWGIDSSIKETGVGYTYGWEAYNENSFRKFIKDVDDEMLCEKAKSNNLDGVIKIKKLHPVDFTSILCN